MTHCCKSHHTATAKFSSNATISFSRKSTRKIPLVKTKPFLSTSYGNPSATVVKQHPKISNFLHYASVTAGKCTIVLVQGNVFKAAKTSQTGVPSQNNWDFIRTDKVNAKNVCVCFVDTFDGEPNCSMLIFSKAKLYDLIIDIK